MTNHNAANERIKRQYFAYLAEAQGYSEASVDAAAKATLTVPYPGLAFSVHGLR